MSSFFDLPSELRIIVYTELSRACPSPIISESGCLYVEPSCTSDSNTSIRALLNLTATNRKLRDEVIRYTAHPVHIFQSPRGLLNFTTRAPSSVDRLAGVQIQEQMCTQTEWSDLEQACQSFTKKAHLESFTILVCSRDHGRHRSAMRTAIALRPLIQRLHYVDISLYPTQRMLSCPPSLFDVVSTAIEYHVTFKPTYI